MLIDVGVFALVAGISLFVCRCGQPALPGCGRNRELVVEGETGYICCTVEELAMRLRRTTRDGVPRRVHTDEPARRCVVALQCASIYGHDERAVGQPI